MAATSRKKKIGVNLAIHIILLILAVICLAPIALVFINSFKENAEIVANPLSIPVVLHLENYISAWETGNFSVGFINRPDVRLSSSLSRQAWRDMYSPANVSRGVEQF